MQFFQGKVNDISYFVLLLMFLWPCRLPPTIPLPGTPTLHRPCRPPSSPPPLPASPPPPPVFSINLQPFSRDQLDRINGVIGASQVNCKALPQGPGGGMYVNLVFRSHIFLCTICVPIFNERILVLAWSNQVIIQYMTKRKKTLAWVHPPYWFFLNINSTFLTVFFHHNFYAFMQKEPLKKLHHCKMLEAW